MVPHKAQTEKQRLISLLLQSQDIAANRYDPWIRGNTNIQTMSGSSGGPNGSVTTVPRVFLSSTQLMHQTVQTMTTSPTIASS